MIVTHSAEICYWSKHEDETSVWYKEQGYAEWYLTVYPGWESDTKYIVNDEWAELRKANADGKRIEMEFAYGHWGPVANDWWKNDFYTDQENMHNAIKRFRISQKEWYEDIPKQGVICWVWDDENDEKDIDIIYELVKFVKDGVKCIGHVGRIGTWKYAKPIKPEECWNGQSY